MDEKTRRTLEQNNTDRLTQLADQLKQWSWEDHDKHPKDRLTDHQALDIAVRLLAVEQV